MSNWQTPITTWGQAGQTSPGVDDFNRMEGNIGILGKYDRAPGYGTATGTNAKTITLNPAPGSYYDGLCFAFKNITENTGAVTIDVNGLGAKAVKKPNGNDVAAGNLKAGSIYTLRYNGTNFILQGSDSAGNAMPADVLAGKTFSNDAGPDQVGTMPNRGAVIITPSWTAEQAIQDGYHNGSGKVKPAQVTVGDSVVYYNFTESFVSSSTYTKVYAALVKMGGTYRVKFTIRATTGTIAYGKIYVNDVAVGTEKYNDSETYIEVSDDVTVVANDNIQLYVRSAQPGFDIWYKVFKVATAEGYYVIQGT